MSRISLLAAAVAVAVVPAPLSSAQVAVPDYIAAAVNDPARPQADTVRDANRRPGESVAFATMKPGDVVVDYLPGGGYFTRIFSKTVGPGGKVYAAVPAENMERRPQAADAVRAIAADPAYANVTVIHPANAAFSIPEPADIIWTSLNYHDIKNTDTDMLALNRGIFNALKPGGVYYVIDHASAPGAGFTVTETLHRADPEAVKAEILAAGFVLEAEGTFLRNPEDDHSLRVNEQDIQGRTDQFVLRFRKPQ